MEKHKNIWIITMNMPTRGGHAVHQIIAKIPRWNNELDALSELLLNDFVIVDEMYANNSTEGDGLTFHGKVLLNTTFIGKVKKSNRHGDE